jgi:hypothetical protein
MTSHKENPPVDSAATHTLLHNEARTIAYYLTGREAEKFIVERYVTAVDMIFKSAPAPDDRNILSFVRNHPSTLPFFDAASAVFFSRNQLRARILLMVAILETTPEYCGHFFPSPFTKGRFILDIIGIIFKTSIQTFIGIFLILTVRLKQQ